MNAGTVIICPSYFFRVSDIRKPAAFFLSSVWTALFHTFDVEYIYDFVMLGVCKESR